MRVVKNLACRIIGLSLAAGAFAAAFAQSESSPGPVAQAAVDVGATPVVTLDPGMHTGPIRRIAVSASETTLVTASDDKSARVWDLASNRLLATLHPPVGPDQIGRLYGASISRDNRVAVAGTTAIKGGTHRIYLFDLQSYAFAGVFDARGGDIKRLAWSPDGKLLAAAYAGAPAVRVFNNRGDLVYEELFAGDAYHVAFDSTRRMAVSATDGRIHLYLHSDGHVTPDGILVAALNDPRGIQFSPDGTLLAVGYLSRQSKDLVRVDVFDLASRRLARSFTFSDVSQGNLMNVAWQSDGRALYVGGTGYRGKNRFVIKRISLPDGTVSEIEAGTNSILDFAALRDGRIVFSTAEPAWGVIEGDRVRGSIAAATAQFYDASVLTIDDDGVEVSWRYRTDEAPVRFNIADRQIRDGSGNAKRLAESSTWSVRVADWENDFNPKINGSAIRLEPTEVSRASVVLPGNAGVILGSSRSLRRFNPEGKEIWAVAVPTEVRAVNVTKDGKIVVAAMLDGTIRWRRVSDGALLMSLFTTRDRRWVMWTELGYFDVSAGAEDLVGWVVNRITGEQADYYPVSRFRAKYFRPDVIDGVLRSGNADTAVAKANAERQRLAEGADEPVRQRVNALIAAQPVQEILPPAVSLLSPAAVESAESTLTVDYELHSMAQNPVTSLSVRVDGRPFEGFSNRFPSASIGDNTGKVTLTLPKGNSQVQIFAHGKTGTSAPATLSYTWRPPTLSPSVAEVVDKRARLYLLSVGVSRYAKSNYDLKLAAKDATDFVQTMKKQQGQFYRQVDAQLLTDERATRSAVLAGIQWLKSVTTPGDIGILYIAGHGINDVDDTYYFLPHDADADQLSRTSVGEEVFRDALTTMKGKSFFFVDTCYSGKSVGVFSNVDLTRIANKFSSPEYGVIVFSASQARQESMEKNDWGNGAFTKALVEGLLGRADYRKEGVVTYKGLDYFVSDEVKKLTSGLQTPVTTVPVGLGDFALAKVLQGSK